MRKVAGLVLMLLAMAGLARAEPLRQDISGLAAPEITTLQKRLADAGCYAGPLDGKASPAVKTALAACPEQRPKLVIETGFHVASIKRIGVNRACTLAATASVDKSLRIWSLPDGGLQRTIRLASNDGSYGKLFATAMSPDGRFVVAGGFDARGESTQTYSFYVFDVAKGNLLARLGDFDDVVFNLNFSGDGHWLVASVADQGIHVFDASDSSPKNWSEVGKDLGYGADTLSSAFAPDGRIATIANNGKLRVYSPAPALRKTNDIALSGGKKPFNLAFDPAGQLLAIAYDDTATIDLLDARDFHQVAKIDTGSLGDGHVAWSSDGKRILAIKRVASDSSARTLVAFDRTGKKLDLAVPVSDTSLQTMNKCGNGLIYSAEDPALGLVDGANVAKVLHKTVSAKMTNKLRAAFTISGDGKIVRFGLGYGDANPVRFDLGQAILSDAPKPDSTLVQASLTGLPVTKWEDEPQPLLGQKKLDIASAEISRALAIRSDLKGFAVGMEFSLRAFDPKGVQLWRKAAPATTWGVNLTPDGRLIVAAYADGTIRWHRWSDGQELLALFVNRDTRAWVAWTPSGYYSASPGGEEMIGWRVNRGYEQLADFFPADRFRSQFARPDIVERMLDTMDEAAAIKQANAAKPAKADAAPLLNNLPPVISILSPVEGAIPDGPKLVISYIVRSPSGLPVDAVEPRVNGRPLGAPRTLDAGDPVRKCLEETQGLGKAEGALQGCRGTLTIDMPASSAEIGLAARAGARFGEAAILKVTRAAPPPSNDNLKPKLYALVVGVSDYVNPDYRLGLAAKDAKDFKAALDNQKGGLYSDVTIRLLTDRQASVAAIKDGLDWLSRQVTAKDVAMVYFAGHGEVDARTSKFYLLAAEGDRDRLFSTALSREDFNSALELVPGKAIVFLDACHSGAISGGSSARGLGTFNVNDVVKDMANADNGIVLFTASTGKQVSLENPDWGNGAFTKALVEGLGIAGVKGRANVMNGGAITLAELQVFIAERVKQLTNGAQSPVLINPKGVPNYPLALAR